MKAIRQPIALLLLLAMFVACGASQREKTIRATLVTVNAAGDGLVKLDAQLQADIVARATSFDAGKAALAEHRDRREVVLKAFIVAYHAIAAAILLNNDDKSLSDVLQAAKLLKEAIDEFANPSK